MYRKSDFHLKYHISDYETGNLRQKLLHQKLAIWWCTYFRFLSKRRIGIAHLTITKNLMQQATTNGP
jgi:hypothetical protein